MAFLAILAVLGVFSVCGVQSESLGTELFHIFLQSSAVKDGAEDKVCADCIKLASDTKTVMSSEAFAKKVAEKLDQFCVFAGQSEKNCQKMVESTVKSLASGYASGINAKVSCEVLLFCPPRTPGATTTTAKPTNPPMY